MSTHRTYRAQIEAMLDAVRASGVTDARVLAALAAVPRHEFVGTALRGQAYADVRLPLGDDVTISKPSTVARMTELLDVREGERVLEIGTGSGYQAAVLAALGARVFTVERHARLHAQATATLDRLGIRVRTRHGDGTYGWSGYAPFDAIVVTAGGPAVPAELVEQLRAPAAGRPDARLVIPVGPPRQMVLHRITRTGPGETAEERLDDATFVPLIRG